MTKEEVQEVEQELVKAYEQKRISYLELQWQTFFVRHREVVDDGENRRILRNAAPLSPPEPSFRTEYLEKALALVQENLARHLFDGYAQHVIVRAEELIRNAYEW